MKQNKKYSEAEWATDVRTCIKKRAEMLRDEIEARKTAIERAPEGTLRAIRYGNSFQYYNRTEAKDTHGIYIPKKELKLAGALAQKAYDKKFVAQAAKELEILDEYLSKTESKAIEKIYDSMHPGKKLLISPVYEDEKAFVNNWESIEYPPGYFMEGVTEHYSDKGERVRSKTEENIANMLKMYGVPYRYEFPILLDNIERRPDFTCLNIRKRKEFIWEHFGMMDAEDYAGKNVDKIGRYILNGYIPGKNFIMIFETQNKPLHSEVIRSVIESYLI